MHPVRTARAGHTGPAPLSVVAVIPARFHSTRLPGKPLAELGGRPLIEHVYRRAAAAARVRRVIVATDDARIHDAVVGFGGEAVMTRADHQSGTDRLAEVAAGLDCDLVVNVQGDEPLISPEAIDAAIGAFDDDADLPMATLRRRLGDARDLHNRNVVKVVVNERGDALYFSRAPIPWGRDAADGFVDGPTFKHIGLYVYRRETLLALAALPRTALERAEALEQLRALEHGLRIGTVETAYDSIGVDTQEDLDEARRLVDRLPDTGSP